MSNTPSDDALFELIKAHFGLDKRPFDTVIDRKTGRFHDAARYRDFAAAVLAKWGAPQPVVREPLTTLTIAPVRRFLADRGIYLSDETTKELIVVAHGITQKGGQHGTER